MNFEPYYVFLNSWKHNQRSSDQKRTFQLHHSYLKRELQSTPGMKCATTDWLPDNHHTDPKGQRTANESSYSRTKIMAALLEPWLVALLPRAVLGSCHMKPSWEWLPALPEELLELKFPLLHICFSWIVWIALFKHQHNFLQSAQFQDVSECSPKHLTPAQYCPESQGQASCTHHILPKDINCSPRDPCLRDGIAQLPSFVWMLQWHLWSSQSTLRSNPTYR